MITRNDPYSHKESLINIEKAITFLRNGKVEYFSNKWLRNMRSLTKFILSLPKLKVFINDTNGSRSHVESHYGLALMSLPITRETNAI